MMLTQSRQLKKLREVGDIIRGLTYKPDQVRDEQSGIACFRTKNIQSTLDETDIVYIDKSLIKDEEKLLRKGDILISSANSLELLGKCCFIDTLDYPATLGGFICCLRPNELVDAMYLYYFFNSERIQRQVRNLANKTTGIANLPIPRMMESLQIPLPPLEEQKKIVAYLDELNATISKLKSEYQSQLAMLDEMRNSSLDLAFGGSRERAYNLNNWKWVKLGEVCEIIGGGTPSKGNPVYYENGIIPWATVRDMKTDYISATELLITEDGLKNSSSNIVPKEGIVIATRVGLGKVCKLQQDTAINQDLKGLLPIKDLNSDFLFLFLKSRSEYIISQGTGATVQGVKLDFIKNIELPLPSLEEQSQIIKHLDQVHQQITALKAQVNSQIDRCDELWQSSLDNVLTQGVK